MEIEVIICFLPSEMMNINIFIMNYYSIPIIHCLFIVLNFDIIYIGNNSDFKLLLLKIIFTYS